MNRKQRRSNGNPPGFDVVTTAAPTGHGCEWCPCTEAEEAAHPEWHDPNRCPRNCTADATDEITFIARCDGDRLVMRACDEHSAEFKMLFLDKVAQAFGLLDAAD